MFSRKWIWIGGVLVVTSTLVVIGLLIPDNPTVLLVLLVLGISANVIQVCICIRDESLAYEKKKDLDVIVRDAIHTVEAQHNMAIHFIELKLCNNTERVIRIEDVAIFDGKRELRLIAKGHTAPITSFKMLEKSKRIWRCFFVNQYFKQVPSEVTLSIHIMETLEKTYKLKFRSSAIEPMNFPTGEIFWML
ncbi:MAG: hypothetical protein GF411_18545 [Candidatus Lokiarchaeota archaeon]|nr:hypothetical protein [Candidatus Lokiarchaeota archaeon]